MSLYVCVYKRDERRMSVNVSVWHDTHIDTHDHEHESCMECDLVYVDWKDNDEHTHDMSTWDVCVERTYSLRKKQRVRQ